MLRLTAKILAVVAALAFAGACEPTEPDWEDPPAEDEWEVPEDETF